MNKYQFAALFFSINLLQPVLNPFIKVGFIVCATIAFVIGLRYNE